MVARVCRLALSVHQKFRLVGWALFFFCISSLFSQNRSLSKDTDNRIAEIRNSNLYYWGEGTSTSMEMADNEALSMLASQISTRIESHIEIDSRETNGHLTQISTNGIKVGSNATLKNVGQLVFYNSNQATVTVLRYVSKGDYIKLLEDKRNKIIYFELLGDRALRNLKLDDAFKFFNWSSLLLRTHPEEFDLIDNQGENLLLKINSKLDSIKNQLNYQWTVVHLNNGMKYIRIHFKFIKNLNPDFEFSYWDGKQWILGPSIQNGFVDLPFNDIYIIDGSPKIRIDYYHEQASELDTELKEFILSEKFLVKAYLLPFNGNKYNENLDTIKKINQDTIRYGFHINSFAPINNNHLAEDAFQFHKTSGKYCSLITLKNFYRENCSFDADGQGIEKVVFSNGSYLIAVSPETRHLTIAHPKYGFVDNYELPIPLEAGKTYEFCLTNHLNSVLTSNNVTDNKLGEVPIRSMLGGLEVIKLGNQIWMANNLHVTKFRNGDDIPLVQSDQGWIQAFQHQQPAFCYINNKSAESNGTKVLYNWYAVTDPRGIAPAGYHVPSESELNNLSQVLSSENKEFSGQRTEYGKFEDFQEKEFWWSSTSYLYNSSVLAWAYVSDRMYPNLFKRYFNKASGLSVRCLKD